MLALAFRKTPNITYNMANKNSGRRRDQTYPKTEPWYLSLKSVLTSSFSNMAEYR